MNFGRSFSLLALALPVCGCIPLLLPLLKLLLKINNTDWFTRRVTKALNKTLSPNKSDTIVGLDKYEENVFEPMQQETK